MLREFLKFRLSKFIFASISGLVLGLIFSLAEVKCWRCVKRAFPFINVFHFLIFMAIVFVIIWIAYSFAMISKNEA
jgi:hypothetical protein